VNFTSVYAEYVAACLQAGISPRPPAEAHAVIAPLLAAENATPKPTRRRVYRGLVFKQAGLRGCQV